MGKKAKILFLEGEPLKPSKSLEEVAKEQGVLPITDFDAILGKPYPGDETVEEFAAMLREWRREGSQEK